MILHDILKKIGGIQAKYASVIFILAIILTAFIAVGIPKIRLQTDLSKELPKGIPALDLQESVSKKFGDADLFIVLIELDRGSQNENNVIDIRDPRVLQMIVDLDSQLSKETDITRVMSIATLLKQTGVPPSLDHAKKVLGQIREAGQAFNKDYSATAIYAYADVGGSEKRTKELVDLVQEDIDSVAKPPGIKVGITGTPLMRTTLMNLLVSDATFTIALSALIILLMLLVLYRPITKGLLIFFPLVTALTWTLGTMGWLGIPLSIATVGIGAMILGLGVEYGVFIVKRYEEERMGLVRGEV